MKIPSKELLEDLRERTQGVLDEIQMIKLIDVKELNWKYNPSSWSALECLEHLNLYGDFYLPEIDKRINESRYAASKVFKSGWLGNYFAKSMLPREGTKKMKTFKDKDPKGSQLNGSTVQRALEQQNRMLELLKRAEQIDLSKTKTAISISNLIKLKLGDTFRVVIYHNQRHMVQISNTLKMQRKVEKQMAN